MEKITIEKHQLDELLKQNELAKSEIKQMYDATIKILDLLGLSENGLIKKQCFNGEENAMPHILKGAGSIMTLLTQSQIPIIGKKAEAKLAKKFNFFEPLIPVFEKYGKEFYNG